MRYGRTLGFHEPFFYKLVDVLADTMGDVFPELRENQKPIEETLKREEEAFNKTLDNGIALFEAEVARLQPPGSARVPRAGSGVPPETSPHRKRVTPKRRLPTLSVPGANTSPSAPKIAGRSPPPNATSCSNASYFRPNRNQFELYAACVMPDHVHLLFEPQIKASDARGDCRLRSR